VRLAGGETKSLVGSPSLGSPGKWTVKRVVWQVKQPAREHVASLADLAVLRRIERAMADESKTVAKRQAAMAAGQAVGCEEGHRIRENADRDLHSRPGLPFPGFTA